MLILVLLPLVIGLVIQSRSASTASRLQPFVKKGTSLNTLLMLLLVIVVYGMPQPQKSVVALGICTRNCGAALAPLLVAPDVDQSAIVMVTLGIPMMFGFASIAARVFAARAGEVSGPTGR
jgi:BASS family bile acid:Na+ symporter